MKKVLTVLFLLLFVVKSSFSDSKAVISFLENFDIKGKYIELGEICSIECDDKFIEKNLRNIIVCQVPRPGKQRTITKYEVLSALKKAGFSSSRVLFKGPVRIRFNYKAEKISAEKIINAAKEYIYKEIGMKKENIILECMNNPKDVLAPKGDVRFEVVPISNGSLIDNCFLSVNVVVDGAIIETLPVTLKVRIFDNVLIAKKSIKRGQFVSADDFEVRKREITKLREKPVRKFSDIENLICRKNIKPQQILTFSMFERPNLVKRGEIVKILLDTGALRITAKGIALKDGKKGDVVSVRNIDSKKIITGIVAGKRLIKLNI